MTGERVCLDWRADSWRFRRKPAPCWRCGELCHLTDDDGRPVHKVCVEAALTADPTGRDVLEDTP